MLLTAEIAEIIDAKSLEAQISAAIGDYMQTVTDSYTEAVAQAMQFQMAAATQQIVSLPDGTGHGADRGQIWRTLSP